MRNKVMAIEREMNQNYIERQDAIRGLMVGLVGRQHCLFLGPPGTGKSALVEDLCSRMGGNYFRWLLARTSAPEELYGPVSLKALENDSYRRVTTGKLPEADIAFLDEVWKCNSAVLNSLLSVLNERLFFNNGTPVTVPLQMCVGASNEMPESDELNALWDRFSLRYMVGYIRDYRGFEALLKGSASATKTTMTIAELTQAQGEVDQVNIDQLIPRLSQLRVKMMELNIPVSDRKWVQSLALIKANAWIEGRQVATDEDLSILAAALWQTPDQINQVKQIIITMANPALVEAMELEDEAMEIYQSALNAPEGQKAIVGTEALAKLTSIGKKLQRLINEGKGAGRSTDKIEAVFAGVKADYNEVKKNCLSMNF